MLAKTNASLPLIKPILYAIKIYNNSDNNDNVIRTAFDVYLVMNVMETISKNITGFKIYK